MDQETRWNVRYQEVVAFIETYHRNPSKHRLEEHDMLNWLKANRKVLNAGTMKQNRVEAFTKLLALMEENRRVNQYQKVCSLRGAGNSLGNAPMCLERGMDNNKT